MLAPLLGYFFSMITVLTAAVVLLTGFVNISPSRKESHHLRPPVIDRTVMVETQRHSPVAKEEAPAKDVSPVVATAKVDAKKIKHYKPKVFARQRNNNGYGSALGYAEEPGGPKGLFSADPSSRISAAILVREITLARSVFDDTTLSPWGERGRS